MAIGKPSAVGESHYGYKYYKSVFKRKCPFCGSTDLIWAWHWASGNCGHLPDYTRFYTKCGSIEGHIFCRGCDADFSCIDGKDHMSPPRATLTRVSGPVASSEAEAQSLKDGKMEASDMEVMLQVLTLMMRKSYQKIRKHMIMLKNTINAIALE